MTLRLPIPPSVNAAYVNIPGVGRIASKRLKAWKKEAGWQVLIQKPQRVIGPYTLDITLPRKTPGDISNRIKAAEDLLVELSVTSDDSLNQGITIRRGDASEMEIEIRAVEKRKMA